MKILQIHNRYQQPGGEDQVCAAEFDLLASRGHSVERYEIHNDLIGEMSGLNVGLRTIWNPSSYSAVLKIIRQFRPAVVHVHNTFPLISPAVYYAAAAEKVPVVQTLHNYRLLCPAATFYRDGAVCEDCLGKKLPYDSVIHGCYRKSRKATAAIVAMLSAHRALGTWRSKVKTYIALTTFAKRKLAEGGLPPQKIVVKPNFIADDPGQGSGAGGYALYLGRLSREKGIHTLLRAWQQVPELPLKIVGDGPLREVVSQAANEMKNVTWLGHCSRSAVMQLLRDATVLIVPSEWYEGEPMAIIEATACGTPIVISAIGSLEELLRSGIGLGFEPGNSQSLADTVRLLLSHPPALQHQRELVRNFYESHYTADQNYLRLISIYNNTLDRPGGVQAAPQSAACV